MPNADQHIGIQHLLNQFTDKKHEVGKELIIIIIMCTVKGCSIHTTVQSKQKVS